MLCRVGAVLNAAGGMHSRDLISKRLNIRPNNSRTRPAQPACRGTQAPSRVSTGARAPGSPCRPFRHRSSTRSCSGPRGQPAGRGRAARSLGWTDEGSSQHSDWPHSTRHSNGGFSCMSCVQSFGASSLSRKRRAELGTIQAQFLRDNLVLNQQELHRPARAPGRAGPHPQTSCGVDGVGRGSRAGRGRPCESSQPPG